MARRLTKSALRLLSLLVTLFAAIGLFTAVKNMGWLSPFGLESQTHDSQVIRAIERTEEVSLLSLGVQGITEKDQSGEIFGKSIPGTGRKVFMQYDFSAKLGIDGADVEVRKTRDSTYLISVPKFIFIGYDDPSFKVAVEDDGVLSWTTPDIDKVEMVNEILNDSARAEYIDANENLLREQTEAFYDRLLTSIDPEIVTEFEFRS